MLALAAKDFDALVTVNLQYQHNLATLPVAIVVLDAPSSELSIVLPLIPRVEEVLLEHQPPTLVRVVR